MPKRKTVPSFGDYEQAAEWLDQHSTADLESSKVQFEVASPLHIQIVDSLAGDRRNHRTGKQSQSKIQQIAREQGLSTHDLLHKWLLEKVESSLRSE